MKIISCFKLILISAVLHAVSHRSGPVYGDQPGLRSRSFLFENPPHQGCHASTIVEVADGSLMAAWFGGTDEGEDDVEIYASRYQDGRWSTPASVASGIQYTEVSGGVHRYPCWNPILFQPSKGPLLLFFKVGPSPSKWWGMMTHSDDHGRSWHPPRRLPEGIYGPIKNKPIELAGGRILCPTSTEDQGWRVHFEMTDDFGRTWQRTPALETKEPIGAIQPSIFRRADRGLFALGRTQQGKIFVTQSMDEGQTWSPLELTELPNPNAGTDGLTLQDGRHLLVYNHTPKGRSPLNVALSADGRLWAGALILEDEAGEYSYPAVIQTADRLVHITYTWKRTHIRHVVVDPDALETTPLAELKSSTVP